MIKAQLRKCIYLIGDCFCEEKTSHTHLLLTVISSGSSAGGLTWTQDMYHLLFHLLEDFLKFSVLQHQGPMTLLIVTEQGLVHLALVAAESKCETNQIAITV